MATTPPPVSPSAIHTPPTPLHGAKHDSYQPYSVRRSTRSFTRQLKDSTQDSSSHTFSPPSSIQSSPTASTRKQEEMITAKQTGLTVVVEGTFDEGMEDTSGLLHVDDDTTMPPTTMLPTPAKTPRKRPQPPAHALRSTARVLFPTRDENVEGAMPSSRKRRGGRRLDDLMNDINGDDQIEIYTDSKDRIPELDTSEDNPFWDHGRKSEGQLDGLKGGVKRKATVTNEEIEKAVKRRDDGMVYVFRGKKIFRKFEDEDEDEDSGSDDEEDHLNGVDLSHKRTRRFTRSSIQPRLLFPTEEQRREREQRAQEEQNDDVDEEAVTDIDEEALNKKPTSKKSFHNGDTTTELIPPSVSPNPPPVSPLTPTSPSVFTTARTTRSGAKRQAAAATEAAIQNNNSPPEDDHAISDPQMPTHERHKKKKISSPFNDWKRTKSGVGEGDSTSKKRRNKREGEILEKGNEDGATTAGTTAKKVKLAEGKA